MIVAGLALFGRFNDVGGDPRFFRHALLKVIGLVAVAEFVVNLVNFGYVLELLLAIVFTALAMALAVAEHRADLRPAARVLEYVSAAVTLLFIAATAWKIYESRETFDGEQLLLSFAMALWLPIVALSGVYLMVLYSEYERVLRLVRWKAARRPRWQHIVALLLLLHGRVRLLHVFGGRWIFDLAETSTWGPARNLVRDFKQGQLVEPAKRLNVELHKLLAQAQSGRDTQPPDVEPLPTVSMLRTARRADPGWEWALYADALVHFRDVVDGQYSLREPGPIRYVARLDDRIQSARFLANVPVEVAESGLGGRVESALEPGKQETAFGPPGEPGNTVAILRLAAACEGIRGLPSCRVEGPSHSRPTGISAAPSSDG